MFGSPILWLVLFVLSLVVGAGLKLALDKRKSQEKGDNSMKVNSSVVVVVVVAALAYLQLPSLSIDINGIFTYAFDVVNAFMPLIAIIAGLGLGFNLITKISSLFNRAL